MVIFRGATFCLRERERESKQCNSVQGVVKHEETYDEDAKCFETCPEIPVSQCGLDFVRTNNAGRRITCQRI